MKLLYVIALLVFIFTDYCKAKEEGLIAILISDCLTNFSDVSSLHFKAAFGPPGIKRSQFSDWTLSSKGEYNISYSQYMGILGSGKSLTVSTIDWKYDGQQYIQIFPDNSFAAISAQPFPQMQDYIGKTYSIFMPYDFLKTSDNPLILSDITRPGLLVDAIKRAILVSESTDTITISFKDCYDSDLHIPCSLIVTFNKKLHGFPVAWEAKDATGYSFKKIIVEKYGVLNSGKKQFIYPEVVSVFRNIFDGTITGPRPLPWMERTLYLSEVKMLDEVDYSFDASDVSTVHDLNNNVFISVPK